MTHFYNEFDPKAAAWLRELIAQGHLPTGVVDERSIEDIEPRELQRYVQCHFFAGIGGWPLALQLAGWPADRPVWTGSCPCQPFSAAGKGDGFADERHLWPAFHWLIQQCRPAVVLGEQVASAAVGPWVDLERGLAQQRPEQSADALHFLSSILARHASSAWPEAVSADAEVGFPLGVGSLAPVGRLRGYGNAIVPQQAEQFIGAVMEIIA